MLFMVKIMLYIHFLHNLTVFHPWDYHFWVLVHPPSSCSFHCFFIYLQGYLPNKLKTLMLLELLVTFTNIYGQMTHSSSIMGLQSPIFEFLNRKKSIVLFIWQKFGKKKLRNIFFPVALLYPLFGRSILCIPERKIHSCLVCVCVCFKWLLAIKDVVYGENYVMHQVLVLDIDSLLEGPLIYMSTLETSYF